MELDERRIRVSELNDDELAAALTEQGVGLTPFEARRVAELIGHDPTLTEVHIFNVEWSEHCSYKSSRASLSLLPTDGPNVLLGPQEDAGIVRLCEHDGKVYGVVFAHESHNHPSQVLPREGAATGIGGIVRDVDCMGARIIATGDPLRFGSLTGDSAERTRWIADGVVEGIWQYGNALGVPNLGGDVYFRDSYNDNCLVNVVALGLVAEEDIIHSFAPPEAESHPYDMILVGKPTDDSGFGGSAFASKILSEEEAADDRGAVQVDDPFLKNVLAMRKANEAVREVAKAKGIIIGCKDIGGGGFACGSSEIAASGGFGVGIDLDQVHVGLPDLLPETICCAETQERYLLAVPTEFSDEVLRIYNEDWDLPNVYEGARASVVGRFNNTGQYTLTHQGKIVCDAPVEAVTEGIRYEREAEPIVYEGQEPEFDMPADLGETLLKVLAHENVCSREYIYRSYDSEVQGNAVIRPGEADAGVCAPLEGSSAGVALAMDGNPAYGAISAYWAGAGAVAEACRNVAAVGAVPSALTDCLNYGNPENPTAFWQFVEGVKGIADAANNIGWKGQAGAPVPVVSGNVSLYNESASGNAVEPSGIVACVGVIDDYSNAVTMQLKGAGNSLYLVGPRYDECGGSAYYQALDLGLGRNVPEIRWDEQRAAIYGVIDAITDGAVAACHDISDGGLAVTLAEMAMGGYAQGQLGAKVDLSALNSDLRDDRLLFSESGGFVVEVNSGSEAQFEAIFADLDVTPTKIGEVTTDPSLSIDSALCVSISAMVDAWTNGLAAQLR